MELECDRPQGMVLIRRRRRLRFIFKVVDRLKMRSEPLCIRHMDSWNETISILHHSALNGWQNANFRMPCAVWNVICVLIKLSYLFVVSTLLVCVCPLFWSLRPRHASRTILGEEYSNGIRIVAAVWIDMQRQSTETVNMHIYYLSDTLTVEITENIQLLQLFEMWKFHITFENQFFDKDKVRRKHNWKRMDSIRSRMVDSDQSQRKIISSKKYEWDFERMSIALTAKKYPIIVYFACRSVVSLIWNLSPFVIKRKLINSLCCTARIYK